MHALVGPLVVALALGQASKDAPTPPAPHPLRWRALAPAIVSGVTLLGGAAFVVVGQVQWHRAGGLPTNEEVTAARAQADANVVGGVALLGIGALSAGVAALLFWWQPAPGARVAFAPLAGGGVFTVGVQLP